METEQLNTAQKKALKKSMPYLQKKFSTVHSQKQQSKNVQRYELNPNTEFFLQKNIL
jgi:hypothetical protein